MNEFETCNYYKKKRFIIVTTFSNIVVFKIIFTN